MNGFWQSLSQILQGWPMPYRRKTLSAAKRAFLHVDDSLYRSQREAEEERDRKRRTMAKLEAHLLQGWLKQAAENEATGDHEVGGDGAAALAANNAD